MKLVICTKFQVNRMSCVESRPPSRLRVTIFSSRLLGLKSNCIRVPCVTSLTVDYFDKPVSLFSLLYNHLKCFVI